MSRTDTAVRVINASPDRVFAAPTDRDTLAVWLPPDRMTGRFHHFDPRSGRPYRLAVTYADASAARGSPPPTPTPAGTRSRSTRRQSGPGLTIATADIYQEFEAMPLAATGVPARAMTPPRT